MIQQQSIQQIKFIKLLDRITNQGKEIQELREKVNELKKYIDQKRLS
jgi:archaellum component FlaC